jgi:hypothetical protein
VRVWGMGNAKFPAQPHIMETRRLARVSNAIDDEVALVRELDGFRDGTKDHLRSNIVGCKRA